MYFCEILNKSQNSVVTVITTGIVIILMTINTIIPKLAPPRGE